MLYAEVCDTYFIILAILFVKICKIRKYPPLVRIYYKLFSVIFYFGYLLFGNSLTHLAV